MEKKTILALMYYFPPMGSVCSYRTTQLLEGLSSRTYKTSLQQAKYNSISYDVDYPCVYLDSRKFIPNFDYRLIKKWFGLSSQGSYFSDKNTNTFQLSFFKFLESRAGAWTIGEGGFFYIMSSYLRASKFIKNNEVSYLLSSYRPLSDMIVASMLKQRFPHLKWIADMRDYYIRYDIDNYFNKKKRIRYFGKLLNQADLVLTISEGIAAKIQKDTSTQVKVLPNGFYPLPNQKGTYNKFKLSYTGSIYNFYDIDLLFKSMEHWIRQQNLSPTEVEIEYAGRDSSIWKKYTNQYHLNKYSTIHKVIPRLQARKIQAESTVNIMLSYSSEEYSGVVTGKLYDLIGAQKPILCIINGQLDPDLNQYFQDLQCGKIVSTNQLDATAVVQFLNNLYSKWINNGKKPVSISNNRALKNYSWEKRINDLDRWISEL